MERKIKFEKFRNIGLEETQSLVLNSNFEKGKMGNLIIVIGSNNSGKSNVLDGVCKLRNDEHINERDQTNLYYENEYKNPSISLCYKDDNYHFEYVKRLSGDGIWKAIVGDVGPKLPKVEQIKKDSIAIKHALSNYGCTYTALDSLILELDNSKITEDVLSQKLIEVIRGVFNTINRSHGANVWNALKNQNIATINYYTDIINANQSEKIRIKVEELIGVPALPNIHRYEEKKLSSNDLVVGNPETIKNSRFFQALFRILNIDIEGVINAYNQYRDYPNIAILRRLEKKHALKVEQLNEQFNRMYFAESDKYKFTLSFESNRISFGMARGKDEDSIILEYQSVGFRWFFNLFFNFLSSNELKAGDIVIMDEPATNLHPEGQRELRRFIKDFAIKNDVMFVIATQSPFLLDPDYYDELRVVSMNNNRSKIENLFTVVDLNDPDSLLPIKKSLTIEQNVLYGYDTEVVWVEGITDYNYLTLFKKLLDYKNIAFLPFNGVGNTKEQTKQILKRLIEIKFHKRSLLVDGDKAGLDMFEQAKKTDFVNCVHNISELSIGDKKPMMIEDLFSKEDKKKYTSILEKTGHGSSELKTIANKNSFSKETLDNFKQLFELLID